MRTLLGRFRRGSGSETTKSPAEAHSRSSLSSGISSGQHQLHHGHGLLSPASSSASSPLTSSSSSSSSSTSSPGSIRRFLIASAIASSLPASPPTAALSSPSPASACAATRSDQVPAQSSTLNTVPVSSSPPVASQSVIAVPVATPRRCSAPDVLSAGDGGAPPASSASSASAALPSSPSPSSSQLLSTPVAGAVSPSASPADSPVGSFRYVYRDDQNRRRSFDAAVLQTIRSSHTGQAQGLPAASPPLLPFPASPSLSPLLSPYLSSPSRRSLHPLLQSEEQKAGEEERERRHAAFLELMTDGRRALAFTRWLPPDAAAAMRLAVELQRLRDRLTEEETDDSALESVMRELGAAVDANLRQQPDCCPAMPASLRVFLLSAPSQSSLPPSPSLLAGSSPLFSPMPPLSLSQSRASSPSPSPSQSPSLSGRSLLHPTSGRSSSAPVASAAAAAAALRSLLLHALYCLELRLQELLEQSPFSSPGQLQHGDSDAEEGRQGYSLDVALTSPTLFRFFLSFLALDRQHRLLFAWRDLTCAIHSARLTSERHREQLLHGKLLVSSSLPPSPSIPLPSSSPPAALPSSVPSSELYRLFVSIESAYRLLHPNGHAELLRCIAAASPAVDDAEALRPALHLLLLRAIPACERLDSRLRFSLFPAFCSSQLFDLLPPVAQLQAEERRRGSLRSMDCFSLHSGRLVDGGGPEPLLAFRSPQPVKPAELFSKQTAAQPYGAEEHKEQPEPDKEEQELFLLSPSLPDDLHDEPSLQPHQQPRAVSPPPPPSFSSCLPPAPPLPAELMELHGLQWPQTHANDATEQPVLRSVCVLCRRSPLPPAQAAAASFQDDELHEVDAAELTNQEAVSAAQRAAATAAAAAAASLAAAAESESSGSGSQSTVQHLVMAQHPAAADWRLPPLLHQLCFPFPPSTSPHQRPSPPASHGPRPQLVDELGFPLPAADSAPACSPLLFPITAEGADGETLYGCVLQLPESEEEPDDAEAGELATSGDSVTAQADWSSSSSLPASGDWSRESSQNLRCLQLIVTPPSEEQHHHSEAAEKSEAAPARRLRRVSVCYAVCVLSSSPLPHSALRRLLLSLPAADNPQTLTASPAFARLALLTQRADSPPPSPLSASIPVSPSSGCALLPTSTVSVDCLTRCLRPQHVLLLVESLLLQRRVLLLSASVSRLHRLSYALRCLLYPLPWPHPHVPLLLPARFHILSEPGPALVGIHFAHLAEAEAALQTLCGSSPSTAGLDTVMLDVDTGSLCDAKQTTEATAAEGLPAELRDWLLATMTRLSSGAEEGDKPLQHLRQRRQEAALAGKHMEASSEGQASYSSLLQSGDAEQSSSSSSSSSLLLRLCFLRCLCRLLSGFRSHCLPLPDSCQPALAFDTTAFLRSKPAAYLPFLSRLLPSPAFAAFLSSRCEPLGLRPVTDDAFDRLEATLSGARLSWQQLQDERRREREGAAQRGRRATEPLLAPLALPHIRVAVSEAERSLASAEC